MPLLGAIAGLPLLGAIAGDRRRGGCTRWHVVPLLGAIAGCRCWVPLLGIGGGGCTSWRIGCGDVAGCPCWVPLLAAIGGDRGRGVLLGGLDVVQLLAAIAGLPLLGGIAVAGCHC